MSDVARLLRLAFLAGAVTDAFAVVPMLLPSMARLLWGFDTSAGATDSRSATAHR